jgi:hypothetical protein
LDPILLTMLDPSIMRAKKSITVDEEVLSLTFYERPINQSQIQNVFDVLIEVFQYGGSQLIRNLVLLSVRTPAILKLLKIVSTGRQAGR